MSWKNIAMLLESLKYNTSLYSLDLSGNHIGRNITKATELLTNRKIGNLDLSDNFLDQRSEPFVADLLKGLRIINLSYNDFIRLDNISPVLSHNEMLTSLDLSNNTNLHPEKLLRFLRGNQSLISLDLSNTNFISGILPRNLRFFSANNCHISAPNMAQTIRNGSSLTTLNIENCDIQKEKTEVISLAVMESKTLTSLNISYNPLGKSSKILLHALENNTTITHVNLGKTQIKNDEDVAHLLNNNILTSLCLYDNDFSASGGKYLCEAVLRNTTLISLNVSMCSMCGHAFVRILKSPTLLSLNMSKSGLERKEMSIIFEVLSHNNRLRELDISYNSYYNNAKDLADILRVNTTLRKLFMQHMGITTGAKIYGALTVNRTLTTLDMSDNRIPVYTPNLSKMLVKNNTLTYLDLSNNAISKDDRKIISESLVKNTTLTFFKISDRKYSYSPNVLNILRNKEYAKGFIVFTIESCCKVPPVIADIILRYIRV